VERRESCAGSPVTQPRRLLKDQSHTVCRRTAGRTFFLKPSPETNQLLEYALVLTCSRREKAVEVNAFSSLSTHYHAGVLDLLGGSDSQVPKFFMGFNSLVARALNAQFDRGGALWDGGSYDSVEIHGYDASIAQWVYVAGQAVAAGLVERPEDWPGVTWLPEDVGTTRRVRRPDTAFFGTRYKRDVEANPWADLRAEVRAEEVLKRRATNDKARGRTRRRRKQLQRERENRKDAAPKPDKARKTTLPEWVEYRIPFPAALKGLDVEDAREILRRALDEYVAQVHEARREEGLGFLGSARVLERSPLEAAGDDWPGFGRNPRIACKGFRKVERLALYDALIQWRADHRAGVEKLIGDAPWRARFPKGTHQRAKEVRRILAARAQPPPLAA
jgi:hypothetical protein